MQIDVKHLNDLPKAAEEVLKLANGIKIFLFYGEMGAGKTTFINALAKQFGFLEKKFLLGCLYKGYFVLLLLLLMLPEFAS